MPGMTINKLALIWACIFSACAVSVSSQELRVTFLGTGAPRPSFERYGPSILVEAGDQRILVDPSWGLRERLMQIGSFPLLAEIDHVLISHLHFDHTIGFTDLWLTGWLFGRRVPLKVQGPEGTTAMMRHFRAAYDWDIEYRFLVGVPVEGITIAANDVAPGVIYEHDGLKVTAFEVDHMPIDMDTRERLELWGETFGFRFDYNGHSLVLSCDTRPSDNLVEHARGVDVLVHEAQYPSPGATEEAKLANVSLSVHTEPKDAAVIFERTRPRMAVYSHLIPPHITAEEFEAATPYDGPLTVAHDLMMITIGDEIVISDRPIMEAETFEASQTLK
jgi:ribonuclease Z